MQFQFNLKNNKEACFAKPWRSRGFSVIELLVTVAIFGIITTVVLAKNNSFNNTIQLKNLAYEIALTIRQAQIYGVSVKEFGEGSNEFNVGYGVHFGSGSDDSFVLFADIINNGEYDGSSENVEVFSMGLGNKIKEFCVLPSGSTEEICGSPSYKMDISFKRPNYTALIKTDLISQSGVNKKVDIYIKSPSDEERIISVEYVGQVSVE